MEFVAATNNRGKLAELRRLLLGAGHGVLSLAEAGAAVNPGEDGKTLADNARIKAQAACEACARPCLADDSGLEVDALLGAPGVLSARFAGPGADEDANNKKLLSLLERTPYANRGARFTCVLALALPNRQVLLSSGSCAGRIGFAKSGGNGFGYDALFYIAGRSFADMEDEEKDLISHRAAAIRDFLEKLPAFMAENNLNKEAGG